MKNFDAVYDTAIKFIADNIRQIVKECFRQFKANAR